MFQSPFGITACESPISRNILAQSTERFKRLSASLHVKVGFGPMIVPEQYRFKRLSASLHVKARRSGTSASRAACFKRLSASLHVKG